MGARGCGGFPGGGVPNRGGGVVLVYSFSFWSSVLKFECSRSIMRVGVVLNGRSF